MAGGNRYSTVVSWVKLALPIAALGVLSSLFLFSNRPDPEAALPFADVDVEQLVREQRLSQPRFASTLDDGREITMVADNAAPDMRDPNLIRMDRLQAFLELSDTDNLNLTAAEGTFSLSDQMVEITGDVVMVTDAGYQLESDLMTVSTGTMHVISPGPVAAQGPGFTLTADAMEYIGAETEAILHFTGDVRLLYGTGE